MFRFRQKVSKNLKSERSVDSAILEKVLDEKVGDGADHEPHVVGVGRAGQVATHLRTYNVRNLHKNPVTFRRA